MIISHSRQFTFVHIHKTGGTSMEQALDPYLAWNDLILGGSVFGERVQEPYAKKFRLNKHSTVADIETICGSRYVDEYYLFSLVRHPVSRLCSLYNFAASTLNKWAVNNGLALDEVAAHVTLEAARKKPGLKWASSRAFMATKTFSEFIRHESVGAAPGFHTQLSSLADRASGHIKGQFFRVEDQPSWVNSLGKSLGIDLVLAHANESSLKLMDADSVAVEDKKYIESVFHIDYEAFEYGK
jgi:hypothetical protein